MSTRWGVASFRGHILPRRRRRRLRGLKEHTPASFFLIAGLQRWRPKSWVIASASSRPEMASPLPWQASFFTQCPSRGLTCARRGGGCRKQGLKDISPPAYFSTASLNGDFFPIEKHSVLHEQVVMEIQHVLHGNVYWFLPPHGITLRKGPCKF